MGPSSIFSSTLNLLKSLLLFNQVLYLTGRPTKFIIGHFLCFENFNICKFSETILGTFTQKMIYLSYILMIISVIYELLAVISFMLHITQKLVRITIKIVLLLTVISLVYVHYFPNESKQIEMAIVSFVKRKLFGDYFSNIQFDGIQTEEI